MKIPEGRRELSSHVNPKIYQRARIVALKRKVPMTKVFDEALKLWVEDQREQK